ncbi:MULTISPECIES: hypothetical protein [unclassified Marinobacter]|uniref:hypothetical protein n=1 Tax=unclassified Marinobacter TaxID=83889 RepID=UPI0019297C2A|nr:MULTISPECIES: hypothetical protein [unclassified Marinobacter]MBL3825141.1 hypothetical protein [Marinobacter sp. MC3]MBL3893655.1 hypothetical protein [Marinobacter sp. MW3]
MDKPCCYTCADKQIDERTGWRLTMFTFIVCPECGNKRCPRATHHDNACTGSNEPGQEGSRYK